MATFAKAVESGSFAAAAGYIGSSPQMVAKQVAYLETRLGTRLLNRTTRRQSLTEAGRLFYDRCKEVLAAADDAEALTARLGVKPRGHLRVTAPSAFGSHSLMPMVTAFLDAHREVTMSLTLTDRVVDLVEEGFEAAFRIGPTATASLIARPLRSYQLIACASPAYLARRGTPRTPADLLSHELLGYAFWSRSTEQGWRFGCGEDTSVVPVKGRLEVNDCAALVAAALGGFGIVLGPEDVLRPAIKTEFLIQVLPDYAAPARPMHLVYASDRRQTPKLHSFIEASIEVFGEPRQPS